MTGVLPGAGTPDRAAGVVRAVVRAEEAATAAAGHLLRAGDVDWTGAGAAGYREELARLVDAVRRARSGLGEAEAAAVQHAAAVRELEALAVPAWWPPGLSPLLDVPLDARPSSSASPSASPSTSPSTWPWAR